jgi:hypothetical protein
LVLVRPQLPPMYLPLRERRRAPHLVLAHLQNR